MLQQVVESKVVNISAVRNKPRPAYEPRHAGSNNIKFRFTHDWDLMVKHGSNPIWGSVLGMMHLDGKLTTAEANAAALYAEVAGRYDKFHPVADNNRRTCKAQAYEWGSKASDTEIERHNRNGTIASYERRARRVRKMWERMQECVGNARDDIETICIRNDVIPDSRLASVKAGLAAVAKKFVLTSERQNRPVDAAKNASHMRDRAQGIIASIIDWFKLSGGTPKTFRLVTGRGEFGIRVYGIEDKTGQPISHSVMVPVSKRDLVESLAHAMLKFAESLGWTDHKG